MKSKIKKIILNTLKSAFDGGNIDDGSIMGGDNAIDQLYDLFVDEMTAIKGESPIEEPKDRFSRFADTSLFPEIKSKKKAGEILYTNPKTDKAEKLFGTLISVFAVRCNEPAVIGYKGCSVIIFIDAINEEEAIKKALNNKKFTKHINIKSFERKFLHVYKPTGIYKIGEVIYFEGDERL